MKPTPEPLINGLLTELLANMRRVLADQLLGLYLFGSLVTGDFVADVSDLDLVAATRRDIDDPALAALKTMHDAFARTHPAWNDRIEVAYLSLAALRTCQTATSRIARISPGEPLHERTIDREWLMDWYLVRERGVTLFGPPPSRLIPPISQQAFIDAIRSHARAWPAATDQIGGQKSQSYAVLTMCRALYTVRMGEHVSKRQAATWAAHELPAWQELIQNALRWRLAPVGAGDGEATRADARRFISEVSDLVGAG